MNIHRKVKLRFSLNLSSLDVGYSKLYDELLRIEDSFADSPALIERGKRQYLLGILHSFCNQPTPSVALTNTQSPTRAIGVAEGYVASSNPIPAKEHATSLAVQGDDTKPNIPSEGLKLADGSINFGKLTVKLQ